jgi:stage II sporulation protein R
VSRFHPFIVGLILLALIVGLHQYQVINNHCYGNLRLHVLANSDSRVDQATKLKVRDAVLQLANEKFQNAGSVGEAKRIAAGSLPDFERGAETVLRNEGQAYGARAYLGRYEFPTRFYGTRVFPPGEYTAVRVILGKGEGHNWWCVLFPPLCLTTSGGQPGAAAGKGPELRLKLLELARSKAHLHDKAARQTSGN